MYFYNYYYHLLFFNICYVFFKYLYVCHAIVINFINKIQKIKKNEKILESFYRYVNKEKKIRNCIKKLVHFLYIFNSLKILKYVSDMV